MVICKSESQWVSDRAKSGSLIIEIKTSFLSNKEVRVGVYFVGCDQKHEEELDSEAVYKNFVLRVSIKFCFRFELELHNSLYFDMTIMSFAGHGSKKS